MFLIQLLGRLELGLAQIKTEKAASMMQVLYASCDLKLSVTPQTLSVEMETETARKKTSIINYLSLVGAIRVAVHVFYCAKHHSKHNEQLKFGVSTSLRTVA